VPRWGSVSGPNTTMLGLNRHFLQPLHNPGFTTLAQNATLKTANSRILGKIATMLGLNRLSVQPLHNLEYSRFSCNVVAGAANPLMQQKKLFLKVTYRYILYSLFSFYISLRKKSLLPDPFPSPATTQSYTYLLTYLLVLLFFRAENRELEKT